MTKKKLTKKKAKENKGRAYAGWLFAAIPLIAVGFVYSGSLSNGFVSNWDDNLYILYNPYLATTGFQAIVDIFSEFYFANYHPLTSLSYWFEYRLFGHNPLPYHFTNLLLHLLNTLLVFIWIKKLFKSHHAALVVALLFGVHPMHVESVAWISERKDLLYTFFFMLALIQYHKYLTAGMHKKHYVFTLLLFLCSLLSKSAAVIFPLVMILCDLYAKQRISLRLVLEKLPFFGLSVLFGLLAIMSQSEGNSIDSVYVPDFAFYERLMLAGYALGKYLWMLFVPIGMSALHFYPVNEAGKLFGLVYLSPLLVISLAALVLYFRKKKPYIAFGILFFIMNLLLVIQILPVGQAIISERYTYIPYIGIFIIPAVLYSEMRSSKAKMRDVFALILAVYALVLSVTAYQRVKVWKDGVTLFSDVIEKYPNNDYAYFVRANSYYDMKRYHEALKDFNKAIAIKPDYPVEYNNRGNTLHFLGLHIEAIADYNKALEMDSLYADAYANRGISKAAIGDHSDAINDYTKAINLGSQKVDVYGNRGVARGKLNDFEGAIADYDSALIITPNDPMALYNRGIMKSQIKDYTGAIADYSAAIRIKNDFSDYYLNRGVAYIELKEYILAIDDFSKVISMQPLHATAFFNKGVALLHSGRLQESCDAFTKSMELGHPQAAYAIQTYCISKN